MSTDRPFRKALNIAMAISVVGTVPYIFSGSSRYRHEIFGTMALVLAFYHCGINMGWFRYALKRGRSKNVLSYINPALLMTGVALAVSSVMVSGYVFWFLHIPYYELWHYVHFVSGVAFIVLVSMHTWLHI